MGKARLLVPALAIALLLLQPAAVTYAEPPWGAATKVTVPGLAGDPTAPSLAVDAKGNLYLAWTEWDADARPDLFFSRRDAGTGLWSARERVNDGQAMAHGARVALDALGNVYAVWVDYRNKGSADFNYDIYFSRREAANGAWSANQRLNDPDTFGQGAPDIAVDAAGNVYAIWANSVWTGTGPGGLIIFARRDAATEAWGPNEEVKARTATCGAFTNRPRIAVDGAGNAYAAWTDCETSATRDDIFFSRREASTGAWSPYVRVNDDSTWRGQTGASLAVDAAGNAYLAWDDWRETTTGLNDVYFSRRDAQTGNWSANLRVNDLDGATEFLQPSIAVDRQGNAYVIWGDRRAGQYGLYFAQKEASAATWSSSSAVVQGNAGMGPPPMVADPWGNLYAVWVRGISGGGGELYLSTASLAPKVYLPFVIQGYTSNW